MEIRKAYPADAYVLIKIRDAAWKNNYYDILPNEIIYDMQKHYDDNVKHLQDQIIENNRVLVGIEGDTIVGFVFYGKAAGASDEYGEIREIYVLPEYQGRGFGKSLFEQAMEKLSKLKYKMVVASCPKQNHSLDFFLHMGGEKKENRTDKIMGYPVLCDVIYYNINQYDVSGGQESDWNELYLKAQDQLTLLNDLNTEIAVLLTDNGNMYLGLGIKNKVCPIESALSNMYLGGDRKIVKILILNKQSKPVLPCGKCRDLLIHLGQEQAIILFDFGSLKTMTMKELNPYYKNLEQS